MSYEWAACDHVETRGSRVYHHTRAACDHVGVQRSAARPPAAIKGVPLALPVPIRIDTGGASGTRNFLRKQAFTMLSYKGGRT